MSLRKAYAAISNGRRVFNMNAVLRDAGLFTDTLMPRIAIVRASSQVVKFERTGDQVQFTGRRNRWFDITSKHTRFPVSIFGEKINWDWRNANKIRQIDLYQAVVPFVPPRFRPENLDNYFIMWEPIWKAIPPQPDPFLLRALGNGLFAVVAQWDMTPLEQSVLEGRIG